MEYEIIINENGEILNGGDLDKLLKDIAYEMLLKLEKKIVENILNSLDYKGWRRKYNLVYMGNLLKSVQVDYAMSELTVGVPYAVVLEYGSSKNFMPPIEPLERWAYLRLRVDKKEAKRIAWAVAKKFKKEGFKPHPYVRPAIEEVFGIHIE